MIENIIGRKVKIKSLTMQNTYPFVSSVDVGKCKGEYKVSSVVYRIFLDGKCRPLVKLEGLENQVFHFRDLIFI